MAYFKNDRFKKPFNRSGPRFGDRDQNGPKKLYKAECSNCHTSCDVPFIPNGVKPVFCRNCFTQGPTGEPFARDTRPQRREFTPRDTHGPRQFDAPRAAISAPAPDRRIDAIARSLAIVEEKLDRLTTLVSGTRPTSLPVKETTKKPTPGKRAKAKKK